MILPGLPLRHQSTVEQATVFSCNKDKSGMRGNYLKQEGPKSVRVGLRDLNRSIVEI